MATFDLRAMRQLPEEGSTETINGIEFHVSMSPYFLPEQLECRYDNEKGCLHIDFKYIDDERGQAVNPEEISGLASLTVGKHTGRLLSVAVHVDRNEIDAVRMVVSDKVPKAIESYAESHHRIREHYKAAEEALIKNSEGIAEAAMS